MPQRLLFLNPSIRESDVPKHMPLGILWLASCAEEWYGIQTALFDINATRSVLRSHEADGELVNAVKAEDWDAIGIGGITTTYSSIKHSLKLIRPIYNGPIILGGGGFTAQPQDWMKLLPEVDVGVFGEAFVTIGGVMEHSSDRDFAEVQGLFYREGYNIISTKEQPLLPDMDVLPLPKYDLAPLDIYFKNSSILLSEESMTAKRRLDYAASIGCSLSCRFCYDLGLTGSGFIKGEAVFPRSHPEKVPRLNRWRSPERCVADWKLMREKYGCDFIALLDENLMTMNAVYPTHDWIEKISALCIENGLQPSCIREGKSHDATCEGGVHFGGTSHASLVTPRALKAMKQMGFSYLDYGYEAWDDRLLKWVRKGSSLKTNTRSLIMTMRHGIRPVPNNITGFEPEDFESIRRMMVAWETLGIVVMPFLFTPYPGADIWYRNKEKILAEYGGNMDLFLKSLNDATEPVVSISENFTLEEILRYRFHMVKQDKEAIDDFENVWRKKHNLPLRLKPEQGADWVRFRAEVQRYADEAWSEKYAEEDLYRKA